MIGSSGCSAFFGMDVWSFIVPVGLSSEIVSNCFRDVLTTYYLVHSRSIHVDMAAVNTICKSGNTSDSTEEHQGGDVYLDITSEAAWKIQIQELK